MSSSVAQRLTYRDARDAFVPAREPLRKFANPNVVCEGWYAAGRTARFRRGTVQKVWVGSRSIVLFRSLSGALHALESACPHLGADLANGRVTERGLQCEFHRWCWGEDGLCSGGGGLSEGRRIRKYTVRERWGVVWVWIGETPKYELPEPSSSNSRRVLRLPAQRINCHPHMILGNGLDFSHIGHVHRFQLLEDPIVDLGSPHRLKVEIHTRLGATWIRRLLRLTGREARWTFTTHGPSLAWLSVQSPAPFELLWAARPLPDGSSATQTLIFLPNWRRLLTSLPMMIATTKNDKAILEGLRFRQGFVSSDAVFHLYAQLIEKLPEWSA